MTQIHPKQEISLAKAEVRFSAKAAGGVLLRLGQLCTAHQPLARNTAEGPLDFGECVLPTHFGSFSQIAFGVSESTALLLVGRFNSLSYIIPRLREYSRSRM